MVKPNLILVLGDQLTLDLAAIRQADKSKDIIIMAEADAEAEYVNHHPKKIAFIFSAMRHLQILSGHLVGKFYTVKSMIRRILKTSWRNSSIRGRSRRK